MTQEKVIEILYQLGFQPELVDENFGYRFEYEGLTILYAPEGEDSHTLYMMVPNIFDVTDENRTAVMAAMVRLAGKMKFVQPVLASESVWLNYQHYLGEGEPTVDLMEHMVRVLAVSRMQFHKIISNEGNEQ